MSFIYRMMDMDLMELFYGLGKFTEQSLWSFRGYGARSPTLSQRSEVFGAKMLYPRLEWIEIKFMQISPKISELHDERIRWN